MAGLITGLAAKNFCGRYLVVNSKCMNYCLTRYLSGSKDGDKPKKPATHFILFYKSIQDTLDAKSPGGNVTQKVKLASQMYKELSTEEKQALNEKSTKLLEEYKKKVAIWQSSLPPEERAKISENMKMKRDMKEKRKIRKLQRENEKPKQTHSAFVLYRSDQLKKVDLKMMTPKERLELARKSMSEHAKQWKALSEGEKEFYTTMAAEEKKIYEADIQQWEQDMIKQGKENLIRKKTLVKLQRARRKSEGTKRTRSKTVAKKSGVKPKTAAKSPKVKEGAMKKVKKQVRFADSDGGKSSDSKRTK